MVVIPYSLLTCRDGKFRGEMCRRLQRATTRWIGRGFAWNLEVWYKQEGDSPAIVLEVV